VGARLRIRVLLTRIVVVVDTLVVDQIFAPSIRVVISSAILVGRLLMIMFVFLIIVVVFIRVSPVHHLIIL
jgi:hypothetical protein